MKPGLLLLNKPVGLRSSYCVDRIRKILGKNVKTGHGGTLDSTASGLLVILVGGATRLSSTVMGMTKVYRATIRLGTRTSTCDYTGEVLETSDWSGVKVSDIDEIFFSMLGWRMQMPPKVSALHVGGKRAHEIFRDGGEPDLKPRPVFIKSLTRTSDISESGCFDVRVVCSKGTYVRSIAEDIGGHLGCGAHIQALEREKTGCFSIEDSISVDENFPLDKDFLIASMLSPDVLADYLPTFELGEADSARIANGLPVPLDSVARISLGNFAPARTALVESKELYTIATLEYRDGKFLAVPEVNIRKNVEGN